MFQEQGAASRLTGGGDSLAVSHMILTCPACATSYFIRDEAVGPEGRKVRCQSCGEVWRATPDEPLELTLAPDPAVAAAATPATPPEPDPAPTAASLAETPAPELPRAFRARADRQKKLRRAAADGVVWAGLASVFIGIIGAGWLFRVDVVEMYPRAASAYAAVGAEVNPTGLDFEAVGARAMTDDPGMVLVSGALRNVREREIVAPAVRVALLDVHGAEVGHKVVRIDAAPVLPGKVQGFAVRIADPGGKAAGVGVDFVLTSAEPERSGTPKPTAHPAVRRPPAAADAGLRPAMGDEIETPMGAPVEATPLDARPVEAVSASHHG